MSTSNRQSEDGLAESTRKVSFNDSSVDGFHIYMNFFFLHLGVFCILNIFLIL